MRGTPFRGFRRHVEAGIIPAYAGNTSAASLSRSLFRDHPRVCGEHRLFDAGFRGHVGSSPRMRGTLSKHAAPHSASRDHPRVCGEHSSILRRLRWTWGSSPRMRGTRLPFGPRQASAGIIPAYAGNTCCLIRPPWMRRDHPRVCGEHERTGR